MNNRARLFAAALFVFGATQFALAASLLEEMSEKSYPAPPNSSLSVHNTDGTIYIYGWDNSEIKITARKRAYSKARLDGIAINVAIKGDAASVETVYPPSPKGLSVADRSGTVDYLILVPLTCSISEIELVNGEIIVQGLRGRTTNVRLTNGRIIARNCFSDVHLAVANGGLDIFYNWWEPLRFSFTAEIGQGHIQAQLPSYAALRLDAVSPNGDITNQFAKEKEEGSHLQIVKTMIGNGEGAQFTLRAGSGNILIQKVD